MPCEYHRLGIPRPWYLVGPCARAQGNVQTIPRVARACDSAGLRIFVHCVQEKVAAGRGYSRDRRMDVVKLSQARDFGRRPTRTLSAHFMDWVRRKLNSVCIFPLRARCTPSVRLASVGCSLSRDFWHPSGPRTERKAGALVGIAF